MEQSKKKKEKKSAPRNVTVGVYGSPVLFSHFSSSTFLEERMMKDSSGTEHQYCISQHYKGFSH